MDEVTLKMLEANGYSYNYGGIIDAEGNYVSSVELHGKTINSESDITMFEQLKKVEENYLSHSDGVKKLKEYSEDPLTKTLPENAEEFYPSYVEEKIEKGEDTYETFEDFKKYEEERGFEDNPDDPNAAFIEQIRHLQEQGYGDILTDDLVNEIKRNEALIRDFEERDPSFKKKIEAKDDTDKNLEEMAWYNPARISVNLEKKMLWVTKALSDVIFGESAGMESSEEDRKEYEKAIERRKELRKPAASIMKDILQEQEDKISALYKEQSSLSLMNPFSDANLLRYTLWEIGAEKRRLDSFIEGDHVFNPFNMKTVSDLTTLGLLNLVDSYVHVKGLHEKIINGEELTEIEQAAAEALATNTQSKAVETQQSLFYELTEGTTDSFGFLIGGAAPRMALRGTTKSITTKVAKELAEAGSSKLVSNVGGKIAGETVNMLGQAVLHPHTHTQAIDKYYGDLYLDTDEEGKVITITNHRRDYNTLIEEADTEILRLENILSSERDPDKITEARHQLLKIREYKEGIKKPVSGFDAIGYGYTEVLKENLAEAYGGKLAMKIVNNRATRHIASKPWVKKATESSFGKGVKQMDNLFMGAKQKFNAITGDKGSKLLGSNSEEMMEEILVQLAPVWGETDEEAIARRGELLEGNFYGMVAGQTILMGGIMKAVSSGMSAKSIYKDYKDLKAKRKGFEDMMSEFRKGGLTDAKVEELLMNSGTSKHTVQEYNNKIARYREQGKNEEANELERNKTFNMGKAFVEMGKGREFVRNMTNLIASGKIPPESIKSVQEAVQEVKALQIEMNEHGNLKNKNYVLELKSRERYTKRQGEQLEKLKSDLQGQEQSPQRDGELAGVEKAIQDNKNNLRLLDKAIKHETSPKMVLKLEQESQVTQELINEYKKRVKEASLDTEEGSVDKKKIKEDIIKEAKQRYGKSISNSVFVNSEANLDKVILKEVIGETLKKIEKNQKTKVDNTEVTDTEEETSPEKLAAQEHITDIEETIEGVNEVLGEIEETRKETNSEKTPVNNEQNNSNEEAPLRDPDVNFDEDFFEEDLMPLMEGDKFKNPSMNRAVESLKKRVKEMEATNGKKPTFEDYINDLIDNGDVDIENLKNHMRSLALIWAGAKLGKSNWVKLHAEMFEDLARYELLDQQKDTSETRKEDTPETTTKDEKTEEGIVNSKAGVSPVNFDPNTGAPIHVTPNSGKTYGTEHTIHYSAVEFEHEVKEVNGKKVYVKVKHSTPKMRKNRMFSHKHLVNPNKNNIGDRLSPKVLEGEDLANAPIAVRDKYGRQTGSISFEQWVNDNIPEGMSFEEFQTTDLYISNVPMVYVDANGDAVAPVTEVDWFNSTSVGDRSKDVDEVDLDNLTPGHQEDIARNREQALELRKQIISGQVTEVEIIDNLSYAPLQKIDEVDAEGNPLPTKSLNEVSPDSQIVWMGAGGKLYGIDGQEVKLDDILNIGDAESGFLERETVYETVGGVKIASKKPIRRNRTHYMVHTHTVDGVKKYRIFDTIRKNEQGEDSASNEDIETGRWIMAVNNITAFKDSGTGSAVLKDKNHPLHMSAEQAEDIRQQIKEITGVDVKTQYTGLLEAMIAEQRPDTVVKGEVVPGAKIVKGSEIGKSLLGYNKATGEFTTPNSSFVQNTLLSRKDFSLLDKPMITIKKNEDGSFTVEKVKITPKMVDGKEVNTAETYEDYLKERLSTNIMGYNVGTKEEPVFTTDVQQKVRFRPIIKEQGTPKTEIKKGIENNKKEEDVIKKTSEVDSKDIEEKNEKLKAERKAAVEEATALAKLLNLDIRDIEEVDDMIVAEMTTTEQVASSINTVEGLTTKNEQDVIGWLFSKLSDRETSIEKVEKEFISEMDAKIESIENSLSKLEKFKDNPVTEALIKTLEDGKKQLESVKKNVKPLMAEASLRAVNTSFITEEYEVEEDISEMNEKDYSRASNETKPIDKVGVALKRIFAQVKNDKTGFMGLDTFPSFKMMYDTVSLALSSDTALTPDFNGMMALLEKRKDTTPWMAPLIESLKRADEQTKNQFVYNAYKQKVYAKFATLSFDKNKNVTSNIYDSNANEAKRAVIDKWKENIKRSPINNEGTLNKETLKEIIQEWARWNEEGLDTQTNEVYQNWLSKFGIELSEGTWAAMRRGDLNISESGGRLKRSTFSNLFEGMTDDRSKTRSGLLFSNLAKFAANSLQKDEKDLEFFENIKNHPFEDMGTILLQLAELESQHSPIYNSTSRYVNGKSVTEIESFTYFYEQFKKIKNSALTEDKQYIKDLQELSFSQDSYVLKLLLSDPVFASQFGHGMMDLMSLKELYKKSPMFASIEELSALDYMFVQRAIFQNRNQGSERLVPGTEFKIRMAHVNTLTNSDKGRMMLLKTGVFDFYKQSEEAFVIDEAGNITFTEGLNKLLYDNLIMPEMRRMVKFIKKGSETNIKDYDKGAVRFNILPGLNTLTNESGETIQEVIQSMEKSEEAGILNKIAEDFGGAISNYLQDNVIAEANENVAALEQFNKKEIDGFNNVDYLAQRKGTVTENMKIAEIDFILNSMLTNMNYMQMMAGDPALYYKGKGDPLSTDINEQTKISQSLAINLGKRMAAMIAPGSVLADSHNNTYMQVFLEDVNGAADNIVDIIEMHYSKEELDSVHSDGVTYREMLQSVIEGDRTYIDILTEKFSRVAEFIDIESTDAQEYTTLKEHLYVMEKQGRLSKKQLKKINAKIKAGKDLTKKELDLVLQPIKPVYTGTILDVEQDVNRMVYIKSSSFPLIPQLTRGRKLDDLRRNMEKVEEANPNITVRASYQTANKVGALTSENTIKDFSQPIMPNNMLELSREHFKIQQDVPFKSDKVQDDTVSMGTQIFKLLMGDGIMEIDNFEFEGETLNGKQLQEKFHEVFSEMIGIKKDKFLKSLGLDDNMQSKNPQKAINKLQKLLVKESKSRGFSKQDLKILELVDDGNGGKTFKLPLWLTANSNKYESMLNAMINNKIFKQKIPGNKFVAGSEAGFDIKETTEGMSDLEKSRIVHLGDFKGGVLQSTRTKDLSEATRTSQVQDLAGNTYSVNESDITTYETEAGPIRYITDENGDMVMLSEIQDSNTVSKAQVLLPSKFKLGGVLIDLFQDFDGENGLYLEKVDGIIKIKEGMIDKKLLDQFVFRIPTSSHGLGSAVEVVGFLPPESGDLIITPKGFVAQMGQDFDVDSLTAYQYNHLVMQDGRIKLLTEENKEAYIREQKQKLEALKEAVKNDDFDKINTLKESMPELENFIELDKKGMLEEIQDIEKELSKNFDLKLLENKFIGIHNSVYSNPATQKHISKVLSMSYAEKQADDIESLTTGSGNSFNILSPKYQMNKMNAGSTGQDAIGIYAKGVTLHSLAQQAASTGKKIQLGSVNNEGVERPKNITIGKLRSDGVLGNLLALSSNNKLFESLRRRISTVLDERTNTATDNEKAQILGRTGLNHTDAIAVDNLLTLLGFDSEHTEITEAEYNENKPFHRKIEIDGKTVYYKEYSIPYLLHSQPIIREYFNLINEKKSITTEFAGKAEESALEELLQKYGDKTVEGTATFLNGKYGHIGKDGKFYSEQDNTLFTGEMLENQIVLGDKARPLAQLQILATYVDLISQARNVKEMSQNADLDNLGKSMWESSTKAKDFREFFSNENSGILGAKHLLGEFMTLEEFEDMQVKDPKGAKKVLNLGDNVYLNPTTNQGVMVGSALSLSESLFTNLFPAKNKYVNKIIEDIFRDSNINLDNSFAVIAAKEQIFQEIKKYLTSAEGLGLFNMSAREVRRQLFTDDIKNGHVSLSSYINNAMTSKSTEYSKGLDRIKNNLFLNYLKTPMGENGKPSLITFNNQESFDTNQEDIFAAFKELIIEDISLPPIKRNGVTEPYSTRKLAQELIAYSYVSGGVVQRALEFHKFLPIEYLDDMTRTLKNGKVMSASQALRRFNTFNRVSGTQNILDRFPRQYFQNNPSKTPQLELKEKKVGNSTVYILEEDSSAKYVSQKVKNPKSKLKQDNWRLFERQGDSGVFIEIDVLGETGMSEYQFGEEALTSNLGESKTPIRNLSELELEVIEHDSLGTIPASGSSVLSFLHAIQNGEYGDYAHMREIAGYLMPFIKEGEIFTYEDGPFRGRTTNGENLRLNPRNAKSREELAQTFMHETIHILTSKQINQSVDKEGNLLPGASAELIGLNQVFSEYKRRIIEQDAKGYESFMKRWEQRKKEIADGIPVTTTFTEKEMNLYYPTVNLKEFIAMALGNNQEFLQFAGKMKYLETNGSILRKFGDYLTRLIKRIGIAQNIEENTVALKAIENSFIYIESLYSKEVKEAKPVETDPQLSEADMKRAMAVMYGGLDTSVEPGQDVRDENSVDMLPKMKRTKNKCK